MHCFWHRIKNCFKKIARKTQDTAEKKAVNISKYSLTSKYYLSISEASNYLKDIQVFVESPTISLLKSFRAFVNDPLHDDYCCHSKLLS